MLRARSVSTDSLCSWKHPRYGTGTLTLATYFFAVRTTNDASNRFVHRSSTKNVRRPAARLTLYVYSVSSVLSEEQRRLMKVSIKLCSYYFQEAWIWFVRNEKQMTVSLPTGDKGCFCLPRIKKTRCGSSNIFILISLI